MKKLLSVLILGVILILPAIASAQTIESMADRIVSTVLYVGTAIVVIFWIATAILFLSAFGSPEKVKTARNALLVAIGGTILIIIANSALSIVKSAIGA